MQILAQLGGQAFTLVCLLIGLRLLILSSRTLSCQELLVGAGAFLMAGIGYPCSSIARQAAGSAGGAREAWGWSGALPRRDRRLLERRLHLASAVPPRRGLGARAARWP